MGVAMTVATRETYDSQPTGEMARWVGIAQAAAMLADRIAPTEFVPESMRDNPAVVTAAIMYGDELGVGPMQALAGINVIRGKPTPSSELMRALVYRAGHSLRVLKSDGNVCRIAGKRRDEKDATVIEWSLDMARAAGLLDSNPTWRRYPRAMLLARCTSELCRVMFPDVVKGLGHVADDDATAQGFDDWASAETGEPEPERTTRTVQRKPTTAVPSGDDAPAPSRPVQDTPLPPPESPEYRAAMANDPRDRAMRDRHGVESPSTAMSAHERDDEWPPGISQPPLPLDPPDSPPAPAEPLPTDDTEPERDDSRTLAAIHTLFNKIGVERDERNRRLAITSTVVGRRVTTSKELTRREALAVVRVLNDIDVGLAVMELDPDAPYGVTIMSTEREGPDYE